LTRGNCIVIETAHPAGPVICMHETTFYHAAVAIAFGMAAQSLALRFAVPSIVILLATGVAIGPDGLRLLDPNVFGPARTALVTLAVTVILFEGGLALRVEDLRRQQRSLALLLSLGAAISMVVGALAAHFILGLSWSIASLYGALMIVTGPTVVTPLLTRLTLDRTVRELLIGEAVLIDPVGAIVAIVAAEYVVGQAAMWHAGWLVLVRLAVGGTLGAVAGAALTAVLRRGWIPEAVRNPVVLAFVLVVAAAASRVSSEAGLMAAVVQGVVMANSGIPELGRLRQFKEEITLLLLSFIFVLLAADIQIREVVALGWGALAVVAVVVWVARPLSVFACTQGSSMTLPQQLFVAWICPRGIVAASVAGLFSIALQEAGIPGGDQLEVLVFVTVGVTVTVQGLTARPVAAVLGVDLPELYGTLIVGADHLGRLLACLLQSYKRPVVLMDVNPLHCRAARDAGLVVYSGDALSIEALEEAGARYADTVVTLTRNQELNVLVAQRVRQNFRAERVLALAEAGDALGTAGPFLGEFPGVDEVNHRLYSGRARIIEYEVGPGGWVGRNLAELPYGPGEFALLLQRRDHVYIASAHWNLAERDRLVCLRTADGVGQLAATLTLTNDTDARSLQTLR
jgi:NhaP-type Na+/H+ or K+/H+ antiporter